MTSTSITSPISAAATWDVAAEDYDVMLGGPNVYTSLFCKDGLEMLNWQSGTKELRVLDVAAGPGAFTFEVWKKLRSLQIEKPYILAIDFAPKMIERLRVHAKERNAIEIETRVMDGQALELEDNSFDIAASF